MPTIPDLITHNFDPARGAGRNVCDLPVQEAERILDEYRSAGTRRLKANYLERRLAVEDWLISQRLRKLGETFLRRPIYFFLGNFANGIDSSRPASLVVPLSVFRPECLTFTYGDSMTSCPSYPLQEHQQTGNGGYRGQVFTLSEINSVVAEYGLPAERADDDPSLKHDSFVEVQVWDSRPIKSLLAKV